MNNYQIPVWATLALAGSLFAGLPAGVSANTPAAPRVAGATVTSLAAFVPTRLTATGLINPIGSQVQLTWVPVPKALGYKIYRDGQYLAGSDHGFFIDYAVAGGETHTYTVTSVSLGGESPRSTAATAKVPVGGGQVLFSDSLQNSWLSWSWASVSVSSPNALLSQQALRVAAGPWQALYLHHAKFNTAPYSAVTFQIYGGTPAGQKLWLRSTRNGVPQPPVALPMLVSGQWQTVTISLSSLGAANVTDMDGLWLQDGTGTTQAPFYLSQIVLKSMTVAAPSAPAGLAATPSWTASCPKCGGKAMAHILLAWNTVPGASSYTLYRNAAKLQDSLTTPNFTDMAIVSGQKYQYAVAAIGVGGTSPQSPPASAVAPNPPAGSVALTAPTNLSVQGFLQNLTASDNLSWTPSPAAASYNVYQYGSLIGSAKTPAFSVPFAAYNCSLTYTVTAVDAMGMESLPSALAGSQQTFTTANVPYWVSRTAPSAPTNLTAASEWNNGHPQTHLVWGDDGNSQTFNVYRDGVLVGKGLWVLYYIDSAVQPGESHTYTITGVNTYCPGTAESAPTAAVTAQALAAAPAKLTTKVAITKVIPNDDSCVVFFNEVPGAVDYRVYDISNPGKVKYAGIRVSKTQGLGEPYIPIPISIEWNGIDPAKGADLVVEAVDKNGPFQTMDGATGPGAMAMDGSMSEAINGQGDPSNIPNVLAASDSFHVDCTARGVGKDMTGSQIFFDNFQTEQPLTTLPLPARDERGPFYGLKGDYMEQGNDKWIVKHYGTDLVNSKVFFMSNHLMDTAYDGGGPGSSFSPHNNNASLIFQPKATADISGGKVLHVTFEVDAHFDARRWVNLFVAPVGDTVLNPGKFDETDGGNNRATASSQMVRWMIKGTHDLSLYNNGQKTDLIQAANWGDNYSVSRDGWDGAAHLNGTMQDLDKRHRFDFYLSQTHYRIIETSPDGTFSIFRDKDFPAGASLPFSQCQIYLVHEVYHTGNDRSELEADGGFDPYWFNNRPWCDERHWDNIGEEVLSAFPALPAH